MKHHLSWLLAAVLVVVLGALSGCGASPPAGHDGKPRVVTTFSVLGDLVSNVAGDRVELVTLVGPDGDAHTFEPSPKDAAAVADADVIFEIGIGFEPWLEGLYTSSRSKARRVAVSDGLKLSEVEGEHDPHVWHDVNNGIQIAQVIRDRLLELDPANADHYRANAAEYVQKLRALDEWVVVTVGTLPEADRKLVTNHDTFGYFARRYGFQVLGSVLGSFSTEAADPSAGDFAKLVEAVKVARVPAIFAENVHNPKLVERLARESGVKLGPPLFTDALGKAGGDGETYEKMMRYNVTTIVSQLKR